MADKNNIIFKSGPIANINTTDIIAGQLLFAIENNTGSIYLDKDGTNRIKLNADALKLANARTINGTNFDGTSDITTAKWGTARTLTIGNTGKTFDGSGNISWSLSEIGAAASSHTHSYLPLSGGRMTGPIINSGLIFSNGDNYTTDIAPNNINWYSIGYSSSMKDGSSPWWSQYFALCINNYWGIDIRVRDANSMRLNGNIILNAGNYNSYSPTLTGGGASGTWSIDISGTSARSNILTNNVFTTDNINNVVDNGLHFGTVSNYDGPGFQSNDGLILSMSWNSNNSYGAQLAFDDLTTANMYVRNKNNSWSNWEKVLLSNNYTDYTVKKDGTGASGTWGINISGTAEEAKRLQPSVYLQGNAANTNIYWNPFTWEIGTAWYGCTGIYALSDAEGSFNGIFRVKVRNSDGATVLGNKEVTWLSASSTTPPTLTLTTTINSASITYRLYISSGSDVYRTYEISKIMEYGVGPTIATGYSTSMTGTVQDSSSAISATLANYALKMQTYKRGSTTETYGTSYPLYAQWESANVLKLKCDNNIVKTDTATYLGYDDSFNFNRNSLQYFNISGPVGTTFGVNDTPSNAWWHIIRCTHSNNTGYYTDLAIPFNDIGLRYKRISNGVVQNEGWIEVLDRLNYTNYTVTKTGSGASGTWGISITGNAATATKIGTATIGSSTKPIYLNAGTPTAFSTTIGNSLTPVYMNAGTITQGETFGNRVYDYNNARIYYYSFGGGQDKNWKKIFAASHSSATPTNDDYRGCTVKGIIYHFTGNFNQAEVLEYPFQVNMTFYAGTSVVNSCTLRVAAGCPDTIIRVVRVTTNSFELQVRQPSDWQRIAVQFSYSGSATTQQAFSPVDATNTSVIAFSRLTTSKYISDSVNGNPITITYAHAGYSSASWLAAWNGYELGPISTTNARSAMGAMAAINANGYYGMGTPSGGTSDWIRTTTNGIIPYQSGGASSLGTSSWPFNSAYINTVYGSLSGNASSATNADKLDGYDGSSAQSANTYVLRDGNGFIYTNYINSNTGNNENPGISQIIVTNGSDNYYRKASLAHLRNSLNYSLTVQGSYTQNGGRQAPNYFGTNRVGFLMMNTTVNGSSHYKDWIIMDCYSGDDVGGGVAFGINRQKLGAYIMGSDSARTSWTRTAELYGTHNIIYSSTEPSAPCVGAIWLKPV